MSKLLVKEIFKTIQGEGPFAGFPAVFIRLGSCNLSCPRCDTDFTSGAKFMETEEVFAHVQELAIKNGRVDFFNLAVITGGEPLTHKIAKLVQSLQADNFIVQIETNGTRDADTLEGVSIVCSPKLEKVHHRLVDRVDAWKYLIRAGHVSEDGLPSECFGGTKGKVARPPKGTLADSIYLQPVDEGNPVLNKGNLQACIDSCMKHGYRLCVQLHKIVGLP